MVVLDFFRLSLAGLVTTTICRAADDDRFNYGTTVVRDNGAIDFGLEDWGIMDCLGGDNIENCLGYPDKWQMGEDWEIDFNTCMWCPEGGDAEQCHFHHQSPINLDRNRAIVNGTFENECIDLHWMKYEDSSCTWDHLIQHDAFTVERHALRVTQPLEGSFEDDTVRLACPVPGVGRRFGKIDFSKGFAQWWYLSHIDFHVPSEHTQNGRRYSAEAQMYHFYSVNSTVAGVNNELASVAVFLDADKEYPPYRDLDRLICQWRRHEELTRRSCNMAPIASEYPGCFPNNRAKHISHRNMDELMVQDETERKTKDLKTVYDVFDHNHHQILNENEAQTHSKMMSLDMDPENWNDASMTDDEWQDWIQTHDRRLVEGQHMDWFNYFLMLGVRTEYYFRYEGTQTIPPCYGPWTKGSRGNTTHWRVMKDPIRVHPRQIQEMERLIKERIAPTEEGEEFRCKPDTAAVVTPDGHASVARPLQNFSYPHAMVFCECQDWRSKWPDDQAWCKIEDVEERFYAHPYNFATEGL